MKSLTPAVILTMFAVTAGAQAPTPITVPNGTVGVPYSFDFGAAIKDLPVEPGITFTVVYAQTGGTIAPGLTLAPSGLLSGTPTTPGTFVFTGTQTVTISAGGLSSSFSDAGIITMTVTGVAGNPVSVRPSGLSFSVSAGAKASQQSVTMVNQSGTPAAFTATASGGTWLSVGGGGTAPAFGQTIVPITVDPSRLAAGTYTGTVTLSGSFPGSPFTVTVVATVSGAQQILSLSQTGFFFRASANGPRSSEQTFRVFLSGPASTAWTATTNAPWLFVEPGSGRSDANTAPEVLVHVDPARLGVGTYYGQIQVAAQGVPNSPQILAVVLNVVAPNPPPAPDVGPTGLILIGTQGQTSQRGQAVELTDVAPTPVNYTTTVTYGQGKDWLTVDPPTGTIRPGAPTLVALLPSTGSLAPGVYTAEVTFRFSPNATSRRVSVVFLVLAKASIGERGATGCAPTKLLPVFSLLGQTFVTAAAWPTSLEVTIVDDCGTPMTSGSVITSFSTGDEPISLTSLNDGRWSGTWTAHGVSTGVTITAAAQTVAPVLEGSVTIGGATSSNPSVPLINTGGVVSAASYGGRIPLAPGSMMSIFGSGLANGLTVAPSLPLPSTLSGIQVLLGGKPAPLLFTSDNQINAVVPYDISTNAAQQLLVIRGNAYSTPEPVTFADGGPAVFTKNQSGKGEGIVVGVRPDHSQYLVSTAEPAAAGDVLVIYCAGLGVVDQPVTAGTISPTSPLASAKNAATVSIDGTSADVFFAGLAPGFAGLYQINAVVPGGLKASASAQLVIKVAGQASPVTTIAVK